MLAIGRALMARPRVLLLDEPSMGLAPMVISQIFKIIAEINAQGTTVLLVEQNAQQALTPSDRAYILETGEVTRDGPRARAVGGRQHSRRLPRRGLGPEIASSTASSFCRDTIDVTHCRRQTASPHDSTTSATAVTSGAIPHPARRPAPA